MKVKIVETQGQSALVQYEDGDTLHRRYVPVKEIKRGKVEDEVLAAGIQYGIDWESRLDLSGLTPLAVDRALKEKGIWTTEDLFAKDRAIIRIATTLLGRAIFAAREGE